MAAGDEVWQEKHCLWQQEVQADSYLMSVADGVAATPRAQIASRTVLQTLHSHSMEDATSLAQTLREVHERWQKKYCTAETRGSATTIASLWLKDGQFQVVNSGDSRVYRYRPEPAAGHPRWEQLTRDHNAINDSLENEEEQADEEDWGVFYRGLTQCLCLGEGKEGEDWIYGRTGLVQAGDLFVLCTDGLHGVLAANIWQKVLCDAQRPFSAKLKLIEKEVVEERIPDDCSMMVCLVVTVAFKND